MSYYTQSFPRRPVDLTKRIGDSLIIEITIPADLVADTMNDELIFKQEYNLDTIKLGVFYNKKTKQTTFLDKADSDTIFHGYVTKYRELYYLAEQKADSAFWIGALNVEFDSIQGLGMIREQMCELEEYLEFNGNCELIEVADSVNGIYQLFPHKKTMREVYTDLIEVYPKYKIIRNQFDYENFDWEQIERVLSYTEEYTYVENELVESVFPNPATEFIQVDFNELDNYIVQLINTSGKTVLTRKIKDINLTIPVSEIESGFYMLRIYSPGGNLMEFYNIIIR